MVSQVGAARYGLINIMLDSTVFGESDGWIGAMQKSKFDAFNHNTAAVLKCS